MHDPGLLQFLYTMHLPLGSSTIDLFFNDSTAASTVVNKVPHPGNAIVSREASGGP